LPSRKCKRKFIEIPGHQSEWLSPRKKTKQMMGRVGGVKGTLAHCLWDWKLAKPLWKSV
jgi:hypothetical protein